MLSNTKRSKVFFKGVFLAVLLLGGARGNSVFSATLPTLPQIFIDTTYSAPTGSTCMAANSSAFQTCLNNAALNSIIILNAGTTYTGPFSLPNKTSGSGWIYIISSNLASLPAAGTRVSLSDAGNMPKIVVTSGGESSVQTANNAHHYRFVGIEFKPVSGNFVYNLITLAGGTPNNITFDRCYIHGDPSVGGRRGMEMSGSYISVIDSHVSDFKESGADTQALWGHETLGPIKVVNNYLEAAGENVMFGGADPSISGTVPSDIEIKRNHFFKPLSWIGSPWVVKNLLEFKNSRRVLVEGNIFENNWAAAQNGFSILLTPRNQSGGCPWCVTEDIIIRLNKGVNLGQGINILGRDYTYPSEITHRVLIENNTMDITGLNNSSENIYQILGGPTDVTIRHNTTFNGGGSFFMTESSPKADQFVFQDNITTFGSYGFLGTGTGSGLLTLNTYYTNWTMTHNAIIGPDNSSSYPSGNFWPSSTGAVGFVNYAGDNYRLLSSSPYKNAGTDGKDLGADIDAIEAAIAGAGGTPDTAPPTSPTNLAATSPSQSSISVTWTASTDDIGVANYLVERCQGSGCSNFTQVGTPTTSPFVDTGLTPNTFYNYHVRATDAAGNLSGWSNVVGATTQAPDTTPPSTPTNLSATATSSSIVNLTWTASTDNVAVTGYRVERCSGSGCTNFTQIATPTTTSYSDTSLSPSTLYRYQIRATDGANNTSSYSTIAQATTPEAPPVSANLMAAYNFNEGTGSTTQDVSGHNHTATLSNATWSTAGKNGGALNFNGSTGYAEVSHTANLNITGNEITLSAWVNPDVLGTNILIAKPASSSAHDDPYFSYSLHLYPSGRPRFYLTLNGATYSVSSSSIPPTGNWYHLAGVYNGSTMKIYVNGIEQGSISATGTITGYSTPLRLGTNGGFEEDFDGKMDDVRIYNIALTQAEIQTDMNTPLTQGGSGTFTPCNTVTTANFSQAAYNSYGAPFDAFSTSTMLMNARCSSADPHTISLTTGVPGDTTRIVYTKGYYYANNAWTQYSGTCTGALNGDWCQGSVSATITNANLSTASAAAPAYLVGMTCSVQGGGWKCGCRDTTCSNFYWQVQGAGM
jgi:hypothetical protein